MKYRAPRVLDLIRAALRRVEETSDPATDGQAVQELKSSVVLTIAERELRTAGEETEPEEDPDAAPLVRPAHERAA